MKPDTYQDHYHFEFTAGCCLGDDYDYPLYEWHWDWADELALWFDSEIEY